MTASGSPSDPLWFRNVLGHFPTGVVVVTAMTTSGPVGMAVGSFTSVSLDPPMVAFLPDRKSSTFPQIREAGRFCVNVLADDQSDLCRQFAIKGADKYAGVAWTPSEVTGSPRLSEAVAWIDCDMSAVHDAGDHFIVVGDVQALGVSAGRDPLLFFQGGYGRFSSLSLAAESEAGTFQVMRQVEVVRHRMEQIAAELDMEAVAATSLGNDMLIIASARTAEVHGVSTRVGQRIPMVPPLGAVLIAWADESTQSRWLDAIPASGAPREEYVALLERVRARGWSIGLVAESQGELFDAVLRLSFQSPTEEQRQRLAAAGAGIRIDDADPVDLDAHDSLFVRVISAPVFGADGRIAFTIGLVRPQQMSRSEIQAVLDRLLDVAAEMTADLAALPDQMDRVLTDR
jgi:flavin reductase (DIM6/NTAB) family NADH-FMN oxidoreductase RutF/DNA-binding IclR family transcriptional regulator